MITDRFERESSTANQFSFFNPKSTAADGRRSLDGVDYAVWAERMEGAWSRRASFGGHRRGRKHQGVGRIKWLAGEEEEEEEKEDSGTPSPPLWKGGSPRRSQSQPLIDRQVAGVTARAKDIERYRQELLERVRGMAEADYELSLRDMVESPPAPSPEKREKEIGRSMGKKSGKGRRGGLRSERMERGGFLLKMLSFPSSVGEGKRREDGKATVPPRSKVLAEKKGGNGEDRGGGGWRRRGELGGIGSSSNSSTSSSNSNGSSSSSSTSNASANSSGSNSNGSGNSSSISSGSNSRGSRSSSRIKRMSMCCAFFGKNRERESWRSKGSMQKQ